MASYGIKLPSNFTYYAQEVNPIVWAIGCLRLMAYDKYEQSYIELSDSVVNWNYDTKYDVIVSSPPFGLIKPWSTEDRPYKDIVSDFVDLSLRSINEKGQIIAIVPQSFLFSRSNIALRKEIIEKDLLDIVMSFPGGILRYTNVQFSIIVLNRSKVHKGKVRFIDSNVFLKDYYNINRSNIFKRPTTLINNNVGPESERLIHNNIIVEKEYNFNPYIYYENENVIESEYPLVELHNLINIYKDRESPRLNTFGKFIRIRDLSSNAYDYIRDFTNIEDTEIPRHASFLRNNTLLLALRWSTLKPTLYVEKSANVYYSYPDILCCEVIENRIDKEFLVHELNAEYVRLQIERIRKGSSIQFFSKSDILNIKVQLPPIKRQKEIILDKKTKFLFEQSEILNIQQRGLYIEVADKDSQLRHRIRGKIDNARSAISKIKKILENRIDLQNIRSDGINRTLGEYLYIIERDVENVYHDVNVAGIELKQIAFEKKRINIIDFVKQYVKELSDRKNKLFEVDSTIIDEKNLEKEGINVFINGDTDLLRIIFDNLIENAEKHAFNNNFSIKNRIDIDVLPDLEYMEIQIDFSNTGIPLSENFNFIEATEKGGKKGPNAGDGIGLYLVNEYMKLHGAELSYTDETGPEGLGGDLVTTFELTFPIEIEKHGEDD